MKKLYLFLALLTGFTITAAGQLYYATVIETEPNDSPAMANTFLLSDTGTGFLNYGIEEDYWKITVPGDGQLSVLFRSAIAPTRCYLLDTIGFYIIDTHVGWNETVNGDGLAQGTYYLNFKKETSPDTARYYFTPTFTLAPLPNDMEPNGNPALASILPLNDSTTGHCNYFYNNQKDTFDWHKVTLYEDGQLSCTIMPTDGKYINMYIYDGDGITLLANGYTNSTLTLNADGLAAGDYYVVSNAYYATDFLSYTLKDTLILPVIANDTIPNDIAVNPSSLPVGGTVTGHIGYRNNGNVDAVDFWPVHVMEDGKLSWTITSGNGQDVYALLLDGDGTTVLAGNYTTTTATYSKDGLAPGTYYIKIYTYYSNEFAPYELSCSLLTPVQANDTGSNDTTASPSILPLNGSSTGHI
ncbi:MAG: hypothetical protein IT242_01570, partial [Bacteroidia bacterium]|nr:hypothetical protein [Bacteroidia bacterium]